MTGAAPGLLWSAAAKERLRALWADGHSAKVIAQTLADEGLARVTRSAVCGQVNRMSLPRRMDAGGTLTQRAARVRAAAEARAKPEPAAHAARPRRVAVLAKGDGIEAATLHDGAALTVATLKPHCCRWPVAGEGAGTLFCGAGVAEGAVYCPGHAVRAYTAQPSISAARPRYAEAAERRESPALRRVGWR